MIFDTTSNNIILITYPSGGFGNFLYYVLTEFSKETVKLPDNKFILRDSGDSHSVIKYTNIYFKDNNYNPTISVNPYNDKILILCDNGINNDNYDKLHLTFPNAKTIRLIIDFSIRPVIYKTCTIKAMETTLFNETQPHVAGNWVDYNEDYSQRENFTLLYHNWPFKWEPLNNTINVSIEALINNPISTIKSLISELQLSTVNIDKLDYVVDKWINLNNQYFSIYNDTKLILSALKNKSNINISHITDLHDQGYINYCIERDYNITIPVYDYRNWFTNTNQILYAINKIKGTLNGISN